MASVDPESEKEVKPPVLREATAEAVSKDKNPIDEGESKSIQDGDATKLSKNQLRKRRRYERLMEKSRLKKEGRRAAKRAKALAEGRDLESERRTQEERTRAGKGWKKRQEIWLNRMKTADTMFRVCMDCAYEDQMTTKEIGRLASQIRYCYSANRNSENPCYLSVASLSGQTRALLDKVEGFPDQWYGRAFSCSDKPIVEMHPEKDKLVYLTNDSENTLEHLEDDKIYVIGGIVDRNRLQRAAITRAEHFGLATAKLPIDSYLKMVSTRVLTCNHVFEILIKYREHNNDWKKAMLDVLPNRKDFQALDNDEGDSKPQAAEEDSK